MICPAWRSTWLEKLTICRSCLHIFTRVHTILSDTSTGNGCFISLLAYIGAYIHVRRYIHIHAHATGCQISVLTCIAGDTEHMLLHSRTHACMHVCTHTGKYQVYVFITIHVGVPLTSLISTLRLDLSLRSCGLRSMKLLETVSALRLDESPSCCA